MARSRKSSETARRTARRRRVIPRLISICRAVDNDEAVRAFGHSLNSARGLIRPTSSRMTRIHCARDDEQTTLWAAQSRLIAADAPRRSSRTIYEGPLIRMNERARAARTGRRCNAHPKARDKIPVVFTRRKFRRKRKRISRKRALQKHESMTAAPRSFNYLDIARAPKIRCTHLYLFVRMIDAPRI